MLEQAVNYAVGKGVTMVAAAGNTGTNQLLYPAAYPPVIAVGSIDQNLQVSSFSSGGANVDLLAPGRNIDTLSLNGSVQSVSGTSFAAPQVAGESPRWTWPLDKPYTLGGGIVHFGSGAPASTEMPTLAPIPIDESKLTDKERALLDQVRQQSSVDVIVGLNVAFALWTGHPAATCCAGRDCAADAHDARAKFVGL